LAESRHLNAIASTPGLAGENGSGRAGSPRAESSKGRTSVWWRREQHLHSAWKRTRTPVDGGPQRMASNRARERRVRRSNVRRTLRTTFFQSGQGCGQASIRTAHRAPVIGCWRAAALPPCDPDQAIVQPTFRHYAGGVKSFATAIAALLETVGQTPPSVRHHPRYRGKRFPSLEAVG